MRRARRGVLAIAAAALLAGCARQGSPAASTSGAAGEDGGSADAGQQPDGGKGPGLPATLGPGGETLWLAPTAAPAASVASDADGGVVVATSSGSDLNVVPVAAGGAVGSTRGFTSSCGVAGTMLGVSPDGTAWLAVSTPCAAVVSGLGTEPVPTSGAVVGLGAGATALRVASGALAGTEDASGRLDVVPSAGAVAAVGPDGAIAWQVAVDGARLVAAAPQGGVVVGANPAGSAARLVALDASGAELWRRELPAGFTLAHLAVLADGAVAATGVLGGQAAFGAGTAAGAGQAVLAVEPDGTPRTIADVGDASADDSPVRVAALPHGRAMLYGFPGCDRLRGLTPQLEPAWARALDANCVATAAGAAMTSGGVMVVVGGFQGQADFGAGKLAASAARAGFVMGVGP